MKKQSGFTLIELLLVLAIIGIISAIAIPALLGQRARARDKAAMSNLTGMLADGVGQWDKGREAGSLPADIVTHMGTYLVTYHNGDKNPWNAKSGAYVATYQTVTAAADEAAFLGKITATSMGQVQMAIQLPLPSAPGFHGGAVLLNGVVNGSTNFKKATAIE